MPEPKSVFVMLYYHRHGVDINVYENEEDAYEATYDIIEDYLDDYPDKDHAALVTEIRKRLTKDFAGKRDVLDDDDDTDVDLWSLWAELTDESFEIEKRGIIRAKGADHE